MASVPEYSSKVLSEGGPVDLINGYIKDKTNLSSIELFSVIRSRLCRKALCGAGGLSERIFAGEKDIQRWQYFHTKSFFPDKTIFKDWKAHGWVDMRQALAVSSDVYFYEIGGGFEDVKGLGINKIYEYAKNSGWGEKTGIDLLGEAPEPFPVRRLRKK